MAYRIHIVLLTIFVAIFAASSSCFARTWTDRTGRQVDGDFVAFNDANVTIKRKSDGKVFSIPLNKLSDADREFVQSQTPIHDSAAPAKTQGQETAAQPPADTNKRPDSLGNALGDDWMPVPGSDSRAVLAAEEGKITVLPGSRMQFVGRELVFDVPGSLFFVVGDDKLTLGKTELSPGAIYRVGDDGIPKATDAETYSVWVKFEAARPLFDSSAASRREIAKLPAGEPIRLLSVSTSTNWCSARTAASTQITWFENKPNWTSTEFRVRDTSDAKPTLTANATASKPVPQAGSTTRSEWKTTERLVLDKETAKRAKENQVWVSPNGQRVAFVEKVDDKTERFVVDGKPEKAYDQCSELDLFNDRIFFGNGEHYAYRGGGGSGELDCAVVDGVEESVADIVAFGGGHSYLAQHDFEYSYFVQNRKETNPLKVIANGKTKWSGKGTVLTDKYNSNAAVLRGTHAAWTELEVVGGVGQFRVIVDGKPGQAWGYIDARSLVMHSSGSTAFIASSELKSKSNVAVINGKSSSEFHFIHRDFAFSADGNHSGFLAQKLDKSWVAVLDGVETELPGEGAYAFQLSSNGKHWACQVRLSKEEAIVIHDGNKRGEAFKSAKGPLLSPDGAHAMWIVETEQSNRVVLDGIEQDAYAFVHGLGFSADSQHLAYVARRTKDGPEIVVADGVEGKEYKSIKSGSITFTDGVLQPTYIAWDSSVGSGKYKGRIVINGQERATYDQIADGENGTLYVGENSFSYVAVKDGAYYWVEERREDAGTVPQVANTNGSGTPKPARDGFPALPPKWPASAGELAGGLEVRIQNPNAIPVRVGLRSNGRGRDFVVEANAKQSVRVPNGQYEIYFQFSDRPDKLFQGDNFTLDNNGVEIQIVKVVNGNFGIREVK